MDLPSVPQGSLKSRRISGTHSEELDEGTNSYGTYYLYSAEQEGEQMSFFATPDVHQQILESGLRTGDQFLIRKKAVQNGRKVVAKVEFEIISKQAAPFPNGNGHADPEPFL
jgi:hypothetical protein